ncbi:RagB/SusD family nutrient uptake outer membrane protein, partial [Bacteroides fragilis]
QNLVDDYLVIDQITNQGVKWNESTQFVNNTTPLSNADVADMAVDDKELDDNSLAYQTNSNAPDVQINDFMYKNRDQRFYHSIQYDSCMFYNELITLHKGGNLHRTAVDGKTPGNGYIPITNYIWRKYIYVNAERIFWNNPTDYHYVIFRYGRALLNKAEALLGLAQYDASKVSSAVATFNRTRTTHGNLPPSIATSLADAWHDYKIERHVDLALEGDYYWSLLRWGMYGGEANHGKPAGDIIPELSSPATFVEISQDRHRMFVGTVGYTNADRTFSKKRYLFPITQSIINANSAINDSDQNPGW